MNVLVVEPGTAPYEREINGLHTRWKKTTTGIWDW